MRLRAPRLVAHCPAHHAEWAKKTAGTLFPSRFGPLKGENQPSGRNIRPLCIAFMDGACHTLGRLRSTSTKSGEEMACVNPLTRF
jgi:hypothetical protein